MRYVGGNRMANYHYVYILMSLKDGNFYVGYTKNVQRRLEEHNSGRITSTKDRRPMKLIYWEGSISQQDATRREKYLKTSGGKRYIKGRVKDYLTG